MEISVSAKSVVIVGKGVSVLDSTQEFLSAFDEVAFCNFPPVKKYEKHVGTKCDYMFANVHDINLYSDEILDSLGLRYLFNTNPAPFSFSRLPQNLQELIKNTKVEYDENYAKRIVPEFKNKFQFDPSTGILAYSYFVNSGYKKIGLVGFDFFKVGTKVYYYPVDEVQGSLRYLYGDAGNSCYSSSGIIKRESGHGSTDKVKQFVTTIANDNEVEIIKPNGEEI